ncbi:MAG TPA: hypothetical protein VHO70_19175 [Chitinispirillaceae bacterium]|nr:hypothetical protein [Chitinispirillaceae bacterium]
MENLSFLLLLIFFALFFQMHFYKNYCGSVAYYLMLPIKRLTVIAILLANSVFPLLVSLFVFYGTQLGLGFNVNNNAGNISFSDKLLYVSLVLILIKILPLSISVLAKKHLALVPLFLLSLGIIYLSITVIEELISNVVQVPSFVVPVVFLCCIVFICGKILAGMKME